jgi:hypothetical protein
MYVEELAAINGVVVRRATDLAAEKCLRGRYWLLLDR